MSRNERAKAVKDAFARKEKNATDILVTNEGIGMQIIRTIMEADAMAKIISSTITEVEIKASKRNRGNRVINWSLINLDIFCKKLHNLIEQNKHSFLQTYEKLLFAVVGQSSEIDKIKSLNYSVNNIKSKLPIPAKGMDNEYADINSEGFRNLKSSKDELLTSIQNLKSASFGWYEKTDGEYEKKIGISILKIIRKL